LEKTVSKKDLKEILFSVGSNLSDSELDAAFDQMEATADGRVQCRALFSWCFKSGLSFKMKL